MDRLTVQYGQDPLETDILQPQQYAMVGLGKLAEAVLGTNVIVDGFTVAPTSPASLSVVVSGGTIYEQENLEATSWSSLPVDTHTIVKQGINLDPTTLTFVAPPTTGYAQVFLIQASFLETDTGEVVRPYYDADNPSVGYNGPGNDGDPDNTIRKASVSIEPKAGIAAPSGSQTVPSPDPGFVGLYYVTLAAGAAAVSAGNITRYPSAPFLAVKLGQLPAYIQNDTPVGVADTGAVNAIAVAPVPAFAAYLPFQRLRVKMAHAPTGATTINVSGLGALPVVRQGGAALVGNEWAAGDFVDMVCAGSSWQVMRLTVNDLSTTQAITNIQNLLAPAPTLIQSYETAGTVSWAPLGPVGRKYLIKLWGAGAGGSAGTTTLGGGGGGSGAYTEGIYQDTTGSPVTIVIGAGGAGGSSSGQYGSPGTASVFGSSMTAPGAQVLTSGPNGAINTGQLGAVAGTGGYLNLAGSTGGDGSATGLIGGNGAASSLGSGGRAGNANGVNAAVPGSGGGGSYNSASGATPGYGGNGAAGACFIFVLE